MLSSNRERIVGQWAKITKTASVRYSERPLDEIRDNLSVLFDGIVQYVTSGDRRLLDEHIERVSRMRAKAGFELSDTLMALSLGLRVTFEILRDECESPSDPVHCFHFASTMSDVFCQISMLHAKVSEDVRRKVSIAGAISTISEAHVHLNEETIARHSVDSLGERFGIRAAALLLGEEGTQTFVGNGEPTGEDAFRLACEEAVKRGEMVRLEPDGTMVSWADNIQALIGVPIVARGRVLGAVSVASNGETRIEEEEIGVVNSIADQIGIACDNARRYHGAVGQVDKLNTGNSELFTMLSALEASVYVADMDTYEILAVNRMIEDGYGQDLVGRKCYEALQTDQNGPCPFCTNDRLMVDGIPTEPYSWKFRNTKTGRWYNCVDKAIRWPDGRHVRIELAFDITDSENALAAAEAANRQVQLYNDLLLHDLGNYANTIKGYIDLALDDNDLKDDLRKSISSAGSQAAKCMQLLAKIKKFSKMQSAADEAREVKDLNDLLDEAIAESQAISDGVTPKISKAYDNEPHKARVGAFAKEIFLNLLTNAMKYGEGKDIEISVDDDSIGGTHAWKVTVSDHGPGIAPDEREKIFKRYSRLDISKKMKGTGLGLSIAKTLADRYGGDLSMGDRVEGDYSKGASFSVRLPKA
ncbi:MAG TPA: ATP-binding protein [Thermoplasmata archaeon]|nr:ATP-binding protein [Thermoplasmata archaeon]